MVYNSKKEGVKDIKLSPQILFDAEMVTRELRLFIEEIREEVFKSIEPPFSTI
jgi:hypothetical protein